jgi:hypothetical protein
MSEMVERVAKAMFVASEEDFSCWRDNSYMEIFRGRARIARLAPHILPASFTLCRLCNLSQFSRGKRSVIHDCL